MDKGLVIVHVDGLGFDYLQKAIAQGLMPFIGKLIAEEGYEILPYRCGLPSTTPFCQAGILYGDNTNIPSFRWWDKDSGLLVAFGGRSGFGHVAHKYFQDCEPLIKDGASIAACYSGGAKDTFGLTYREQHTGNLANPHSGIRVLSAWLVDPRHLADWLVHGTLAVTKTIMAYLQARIQGTRPARMYVLDDMLEEIFLHHLTRFAVRAAMRENYPVIYGGFYAYDETAHAFGPEGDYTRGMLRHIDHTISRIAAERNQPGARQYALVVLSDHGQIETEPFVQRTGKHLANFIAGWLPTYVVEEYRGIRVEPQDAIDGHIALTYSGGLAHLYFKDLSWRLGHNEIRSRFPGLIQNLSQINGIDFVLARDGASNIICAQEDEFRFTDSDLSQPGLREFLSRFDDPDIIARQLDKLNSFARSGDLILFGALDGQKQINFEDQVGGHGSIGGEQLHPFVLAKREWGFDTRDVNCASELHPLLMGLREKLLATNDE